MFFSHLETTEPVQMFTLEDLGKYLLAAAAAYVAARTEGRAFVELRDRSAMLVHGIVNVTEGSVEVKLPTYIDRRSNSCKISQEQSEKRKSQRRESQQKEDQRREQEERRSKRAKRQK